MAKTKTKDIKYPKLKTYLCCFGSFPGKNSTESTIIGSCEHDPIKQKSNSNVWFPWQKIRHQLKNETTKMLPLLEGSVSDGKEKVMKLKSKGIIRNNVHLSKWKSKSKSNLHNKTQDFPPSPSQKPPNQLPLKSPTYHHNRDYDTCQHTISSSPTRDTVVDEIATSHTVSLPRPKRRVRRTLSSVQTQTIQKQPKQHQNAGKRYYNPVVGMSIIVVTLVIMIVWGRLCAIVCTSVWLYFIPRFRLEDQNDVVTRNENPINNSNYLDSEMYKKKVVLEGFLKRNHPLVP